MGSLSPILHEYCLILKSQATFYSPLHFKLSRPSPLLPHRSKRSHQRGMANPSTVTKSSCCNRGGGFPISPGVHWTLFLWCFFLFLVNCPLLHSMLFFSFFSTSRQKKKKLSKLKKEKKSSFLILLFSPSLYNQMHEISYLCSPYLIYTLSNHSTTYPKLDSAPMAPLKWHSVRSQSPVTWLLPMNMFYALFT